MIKKQQSPLLVNNSIGRKFAMMISFFGLSSGVLIVLFLVYNGNKNARIDYEHMIEELHLSSEETLLEGLWLTNEQVIESVITGYGNLPGVEEVTLEKDDGSIIIKGQALSKKYFKHEHDLVYEYRGNEVNLGHISLTVGMDSKNNQIIHETIYMAIVVGGLAILGGTGTVFLFYWIVGRHLQSIAIYCKSLDWQNLTDPLALERIIRNGKVDELDQIVNSLNATCTVLSKSLYEIKESETLLGKVAENYPHSYVAIIEKDFTASLVSGHEFKKQNINPNQFKGLHIDDVFSNHTGIARQYYEKTFKGEEQSFELATNNENQLYKTVPLHGEDNLISRILVVCENITERKELEIRLQQAQKMESIGTLAGGIAHDFNNILSSVIGFTELALDAVEKETPIEGDLQEVYSAGLRAKDLVLQILTFARQSDEELKPIQVDFIIKEVLKFIRSSIPTTIEIKHNIVSKSFIMGNSTQIHRIMMNLCTNAAYAMENEGGILGITLTDITIDRATMRGGSHVKRGNYVEIKVSDTGDGIDPQITDKIYEPYFTTKGSGEGTGMGLAVVHGIVETYGGKIFIESKLGKGTVVTIYLPTAKTKNAPMAYKVEDSPTGQERILFVDDETQIVKMASRILGQLGYSVTTKTNSEVALELFRSKPNDFDLVISDVTMPKMTGDQLTQELIQIRPDIPVILCTGYSKRLSEEKALEFGVKAFAYKPIVKEDLAKTVRDVLDLAKD